MVYNIVNTACEYIQHNNTDSVYVRVRMDNVIHAILSDYYYEQASGKRAVVVEKKKEKK